MSRKIIKKFYNLPHISEDPIFKQWISDTDLDDYVEDYFGNLHYKIINELLVLLNNKDYYDIIENIAKKQTKYNILVIRQYLAICKDNSKSLSECLIIHFQNIVQLYYKIISIPSYTNIINFLEPYKIQDAIKSIQNKDLHLYRGFNGYSGNFFKAIKQIDEKTIIIPTFLSTSIFMEIAKKFVNKKTDIDINHRIIWKIIVPNELLNIFNYVYLGTDIDLKIHNNQIKENEFLLNIGAILEFKEIEYKYNDTYYNPTTKVNDIISYTIYTYVFKGWSKEYAEYILSLSNYFITMLSNDSIINTRSKSRLTT
uniref:Uncharacterized protein n=1 Tax=viral metagenome TaxID=1070528 RepID=A0A6C0CGY7_9ZZZZ